MRGRTNWIITEKGKAALAEKAIPNRAYKIEITPKGRAALAETPKPPRQPSLDAAGILRGESMPIADLFALHTPRLSRIAFNLGVSVDDCPHLVMTLMDDAVIHIIKRQSFPENIAAYLRAALKNRIRNGHRDGIRAAAWEEYGESALSEYAQRSAHPEMETGEASQGVANFIAKISGSLGDPEQQLLDSGQSLRATADQLGLTYDNARVRLHRLRAKIRCSTAKYLAGLEQEQRSEVQRLLQRAGV